MGTIRESVRRNLVNNTYIHSNTLNFTDINKVPERMRKDSFQETLNFNLKTLEKYIEIITDKCNQFYIDFGIPAKDSFNPNTGEIDYAGAKYFSTHYLGNNAMQANFNSLTADLLTIMTSNKFKDTFYKNIDLILQNTADKATFKKEWDALCQSNTQKRYSNFNKAVQDLTTEDIKQAINSLFEEKTIRKQKDGVVITAPRLRRSLKNLNNLGIVAGSNFKEALRNKHGVEELKQFLEDKYLRENSITPNDVARILWNTLVQCGLSAWYYSIKDDFIDYFSDALTKYVSKKSGKVTILKSVQAFSGFVLEESFVFGITNDQIINWLSQSKQLINSFTATIVGNQTTSKFNYNSKGQSKYYMVKLGQDIKITTSSGQTYYIQAKNSLTETNSQSIHLQSKIMVDTYAFTVLNEEAAKEFEYLIFNKDYLSKRGLNDKGETLLYNGTDAWGENTLIQNKSTTETYINFFLYQTLAYLLAGKKNAEVFSVIDNWRELQGNLFFLYKGRYLMPISIFLYSAYKLVKLLTQNQYADLKQLQAFGRLSYGKKLNAPAISRNEAVNLRLRKLNAVRDYWQLTDYQQDRDLSQYYKYPDNLVAIGQEMGEKYQRNANFNYISFVTNLKILDQLLK